VPESSHTQQVREIAETLKTVHLRVEGALAHALEVQSTAMQVLTQAMLDATGALGEARLLAKQITHLLEIANGTVGRDTVTPFREKIGDPDDGAA
jgi:hypothetical protein